MNLLVLLLVLFCLGSMPLRAQIPAPVQQRPVVILGATLHVGNGTVIENSVVVFSNGKLTAVGSATTTVDTTGAEVIAAAGKHLYPGLIAPNTTLGLVEIGAVRATRDDNEVGNITPHARAIIAYNAESHIIPTVRSNGVLLAQIVPNGGLVPGTSSIVQLDAWNWEDATYAPDNGLHLHWPSMTLPQHKDNDKASEHVAQKMDEVTHLFAEARAYNAASTHKPVHLPSEAMRGVFNGTKKLYIHADNAKDIMAALHWARQFGISPIIVGGSEAWLVADALRENNASVILAQTHRLPSHTYDDIDIPYKTPLLLHQAGVQFCIAGSGNWNQRNLPFEAGTAVAYGLSKEQALTAITLSTAKILGIDASVGSIETGKDATLLLCSGDILDMRTSTVEKAFIRGRSVDLDDKQKALYRKFKSKYGQ